MKDIISNMNSTGDSISLVDTIIVKKSDIFFKHSKLLNAKDAADLGFLLLKDADREKLFVVSLNSQNEPIAIYLAAIGTVDNVIVSPREIFKFAILSLAYSIIIYHNHPLTNPEPTSEDLKITELLKKSGEILNIPLMDHIIIGENNFISLKATGLLNNNQLN